MLKLNFYLLFLELDLAYIKKKFFYLGCNENNLITHSRTFTHHISYLHMFFQTKYIIIFILFFRYNPSLFSFISFNDFTSIFTNKFTFTNPTCMRSYTPSTSGITLKNLQG